MTRADERRHGDATRRRVKIRAEKAKISRAKLRKRCEQNDNARAKISAETLRERAEEQSIGIASPRLESRRNGYAWLRTVKLRNCSVSSAEA